jgi:hypothetical protein
MLGHLSIVTMQHYARTRDDMVPREFERLEAVLLSTKLWELQPEAALEVGGLLKLLNRV